MRAYKFVLYVKNNVCGVTFHTMLPLISLLEDLCQNSQVRANGFLHNHIIHA